MKKTVNVKKIVAISVAALAVIIVICSTVTIVPAGSTGVILTFGKVSDNVMQEGLHFRIPFMQDVVVMSNKIQKVEVAAAAVSKDLQSVSSNIAVNYRIGYDSTARVFKNIGKEYESIVMLPAIQESMKSVSAQYTAEQLITERAAVGDTIKTLLENKVSEYGIIIEKFNIVNFDFSAEFNEAIEAKQVAEQNLLKAKTEQEQQIVIANADAEKKKIAAEAEASATLTEAEAQAEANRMLAESLNDTVVEYEKVQKWDGQLPYATGGTAIMDMSGITGNNG